VLVEGGPGRAGARRTAPAPGRVTLNGLPVPGDAPGAVRSSADFARQWLLVSRRAPYAADGSHRPWLQADRRAAAPVRPAPTLPPCRCPRCIAPARWRSDAADSGERLPGLQGWGMIGRATSSRVRPGGLHGGGRAAADRPVSPCLGLP